MSNHNELNHLYIGKDRGDMPGYNDSSFYMLKKKVKIKQGILSADKYN